MKSSKRNTLVVNLFGAPGAGKSTGAAYIFYTLKSIGVNVEYVSEFAKDKVWEENDTALKDQNYMFGKQSFKLSRVAGKVDVIVTDSPLPLSAFYGDDECKEERTALVMKTFNTYDNINVFVNRVKKYNPNGRLQTKEESNKICYDLMTFLTQNNVTFEEIEGTTIGYSHVILNVVNYREAKDLAA